MFSKQNLFCDFARRRKSSSWTSCQESFQGLSTAPLPSIRFLFCSTPSPNCFSLAPRSRHFVHLPPPPIVLGIEILLSCRALLQECNIKVFPGWPGYSPDINPQENVWAEAEKDLRAKEKKGSSFDSFQKQVIKSVLAYKHSDKLVGSLSKRMQFLIAKEGQNIGK